MMADDLSDTVPRWKQELLGVPEDKLCLSQRTLLQGLELWDSLEELYITNNPPTPGIHVSGRVTTTELIDHLGLETALRSVLNILEIDNLRMFRSNGVFSLIPKYSMNLVLTGVLRVAMEFTHLHPLRQGELDDVLLLSAACEMCMNRLNGIRNKDVARAGLVMESICGIFKRANDADNPEFSSLFAKYGSKLTLFNMHNLAREHAAKLLLDVDVQTRRLRPETIHVVEEYFDFLLDEKIDWFSFTRHHLILTG